MRLTNQKPTKRRKRCLCCGNLFEPDCRTKGSQRYCGKKECQKVRQRKNEKDWRKRNPETQLIWVRLWNKRNSGYSGVRRAENPDTEQVNREQTRVRMQKIRGIRAFDKSKLILAQLNKNKEDKCYLARGGQIILCLTKARSFTKNGFMAHNRTQATRVSNRLPKGRLYDLSQEVFNRPLPDP